MRQRIAAAPALAYRSDDAFAGIDQPFDGIELAVDAVEVTMLTTTAMAGMPATRRNWTAVIYRLPPFPRGSLGDSLSQSTPAGRRCSGLQTCTFSCITRAVSPDWVSIVR
jgi:hypothetical protein